MLLYGSRLTKYNIVMIIIFIIIIIPTRLNQTQARFKYYHRQVSVGWPAGGHRRRPTTDYAVIIYTYHYILYYHAVRRTL